MRGWGAASKATRSKHPILTPCSFLPPPLPINQSTDQPNPHPPRRTHTHTSTSTSAQQRRARHRVGALPRAAHHDQVPHLQHPVRVRRPGCCFLSILGFWSFAVWAVGGECVSQSEHNVSSYSQLGLPARLCMCLWPGGAVGGPTTTNPIITRTTTNQKFTNYHNNDNGNYQQGAVRAQVLAGADQGRAHLPVLTVAWRPERATVGWGEMRRAKKGVKPLYLCVVALDWRFGEGGERALQSPHSPRPGIRNYQRKE